MEHNPWVYVHTTGVLCAGLCEGAAARALRGHCIILRALQDFIQLEAALEGEHSSAAQPLQPCREGGEWNTFFSRRGGKFRTVLVQARPRLGRRRIPHRGGRRIAPWRERSHTLWRAACFPDSARRRRGRGRSGCCGRCLSSPSSPSPPSSRWRRPRWRGRVPPLTLPLPQRSRSCTAAPSTRASARRNTSSRPWSTSPSL